MQRMILQSDAISSFFAAAECIATPPMGCSSPVGKRRNRAGECEDGSQVFNSIAQNGDARPNVVYIEPWPHDLYVAPGEKLKVHAGPTLVCHVLN